jgi:hypothetical protein
MAKLRKEILPEGEYLVSRPDGTRELAKFGGDKLVTISKNTNAMIAAGLKIPAPFKHLRNAVPTIDDVTTDSYDNSGYWEKFEIEEKDGKKTLYGVIDAPGDVANLSTPAGKLTNTIKEVSACIKNSWVDGLGRSWGPCVLHCAPVLHPVVPGQSGFSLLEDSVALSLSDVVADTDLLSLGELSKELTDTVGLHIPPDTLLEDLPKVMLTVLRQKKLDNNKVNDDAEVVETTSVFMSLAEGEKMPLTQSVADEIVKLGLVNPKTQKPVVLADLEITKDAKDPNQIYMSAVTSELVTTKKDALRTRVKALVDSGRTSKDYADKSLYPMVEAYDLSLGANAKFEKNNVDHIVESLESMPVQAKPSKPNNSLPDGADVHQLSTGDDSGEIELTAEEAKSMKTSLLSYM